MKIEVYGQAAKARWRMKASNGQTVASSGEAFSSHGNAERAAKSFVKGAANANFQVYADRGGKYRWRAKSSNGQTVASSGESFASKASAQRAAGTCRRRLAPRAAPSKQRAYSKAPAPLGAAGGTAFSRGRRGRHRTVPYALRVAKR